MPFQLKRAYDEVESEDGYRVLIDRLWPRGLSKEEMELDEWMKEVSPSDELRKWFDHDPKKFEEFARRYKQELESHPDLIDRLVKTGKTKNVTLLYSASDQEHNNAVVLKNYLEEQD